MSKDHYELGQKDAAEGRKRYKFQDPYLQSCYDKGYDGDGSGFLAALTPKRRCKGCGDRISGISNYCDLCA